MRHQYYHYVRQKFFSTANAEKYVEGVEYLASPKSDQYREYSNVLRSAHSTEETKESDDFTASDDEALASPEYADDYGDILAAAYVIHKNFIAKIFKLDDFRDNPELLERFAAAYAVLLDDFLLLSDENTQDDHFKRISMNLLSSIGNYDKSNEIALTIASRMVERNLPAEFCVAALMQINVHGDEALQKKVIDILKVLYSKDAVWSGASTPSLALCVTTPSTPQAMAALMHSEAHSKFVTRSYSIQAHNGNIAFLFYMQSCWFVAGNVIACKFIDKCLPAAVASLTMYKDKIPEWHWVLATLATYPDGSMQRRWRSRIVQNIMQQYGENTEMLQNLGIRPKTCWTWFFSSCSHDKYVLDEYEPTAVVKGRPFALNSY